MSSERAHLHVYGIRQCDTCRAALKWLQARDVPHTFHDFRKDGLPEEQLQGWLTSGHANQLMNKRSTTWRQLDESQRLAAETDPLQVLLANPTLIKRPVITDGTAVLEIGFSPVSLEAHI